MERNAEFGGEGGDDVTGGCAHQAGEITETSCAFAGFSRVPAEHGLGGNIDWLRGLAMNVAMDAAGATAAGDAELIIAGGNESLAGGDGRGRAERQRVRPDDDEVGLTDFVAVPDATAKVDASWSGAASATHWRKISTRLLKGQHIIRRPP